MMNIFRRFFFLAGFCCFTVFLSGQNPVEYFFSDQTVCAGDTLILPLQVRDFINVRNFQSSARWDQEALIFLSLENINSALANNFLVNTDSTESGGLGYFWLDNSSGDPLVLADNNVLFNLKFITTNGGANTNVGFGEVPTLTETVVENNGTPMQVNSIQTPGLITKNTVSADATIQSVTNSDNGKIDLTITQGMLPVSFLWNTGATTEDIENLTPGTYMVSMTDAQNCTAEFTYLVEINTPVTDFKSQLIITPNPTPDYLRINFITHQFMGIYQYKIYDLRANIIIQNKNIPTQSPHTIDLNDQPPGIYFLEIKQNKNKQIFKIVKK